MSMLSLLAVFSVPGIWPHPSGDHRKFSLPWEVPHEMLQLQERTSPFFVLKYHFFLPPLLGTYLFLSICASTVQHTSFANFLKAQCLILLHPSPKGSQNVLHMESTWLMSIELNQHAFNLHKWVFHVEHNRSLDSWTGENVMWVEHTLSDYLHQAGGSLQKSK